MHPTTARYFKRLSVEKKEHQRPVSVQKSNWSSFVATYSEEFSTEAYRVGHLNLEKQTHLVKETVTKMWKLCIIKSFERVMYYPSAIQNTQNTCF